MFVHLFLQWSLEENMNVDEDTKKQKLATVPFLLNLTSLSQTLLKAITSDVLQTRKFQLEILHLR